MPVVLSGALPLTYPAALGLRPSDRPPPFALGRSLRSGRAKAAGEENLCRLFPAAGAAVAAGPASTGSVAHQPHPICDQKPLVLVTELSANPIGTQKPFISGTKCWLLLYSFPETVILGHGLRAERILMGKV